MKDINYKFYFNSYNKYGVSAQGVHWQSKENQYIRFKIITSYLENLQNSTLLDVGCGFGEYLNFLEEHNLKLKNYIGVDCEDFMIKEAKLRFPSQTFIKANILEDSLEKVDYVICSGTLNIMSKNNFLQSIENCFNLSKKAFIFNYLTKRSLHTLKSNELLRFCKNLSNNTQQSSKYLENDATLYLGK